MKNVQKVNGNMKNRVTTDNEKLAREVVGIESEARIVNMGNDQLIGNMVKDQAKTAFNQEVADYVEKLDNYQSYLDKYSEKFKDEMQDLEIMPVYRYVLVKPFAQNPFQQIKKEGKIITEVGTMVTFKNTDTGEFEEEESYIHVALVMEVGPDCKYIKTGDVIMYPKTAEFPIPFYNQGYNIVDEQRISAVINTKLHERFYGEN